MKDFFLLKLLDRFQKLFENLGIDYPMMRRIIRLKLVMDQRRVPTVLASRSSRRNSDSNGNGAFRMSLILYAFIGLFVGMLILPPFPLFFKLNIIFGMLLFMIMTTMISDFSSVLLDVKDKGILLTRPVDSKTLNTAKLIHIIYYLFSITISIAGVSLVAGLIRYGVVFFLLFLFELILICGFVILFTSILYFAILHFFSGEKLKDIINYFQIALSVFMIVMYQVIGRIFNFANMNIRFTPNWWNFFLPSTWFAAPFSLLIDHDFSLYYILLTVTGVVIPVIALVLYIKVAAPAFEKSLQKLSSAESRGREVKKNSLPGALSNLLCYGRQERVFFRFAHRVMSNERKLKLKLYPSLAFSVIMPFIFIFSFMGSQHYSFAQIYTLVTTGKYYLFLYFSAAFLAPSVVMLSMSENYKGAWIYKALPVESPAPVLKGALKAYLYKFVTPVYLFTCLLFIIIYGPGIIPDLILIFLNVLILTLIIFRLSKKELPFYKDFSNTQSGNTAVVFTAFGLCGVFAGIHYVLIAFLPLGVYIYLALSLLAVLLLWRSSFKVTWNDFAGDL